MMTLDAPHASALMPSYSWERKVESCYPEWLVPAAGKYLQRGHRGGWRVESNTKLRPAKALSFEQEFTALADKWRDDTAKLSITQQVVLHQAYQRIIGMGRAALPLILKQLSENAEEDWIWALMAITGENLFERGQTFSQARQAWIEWGRRHRYLT